MRLIRRAMSGRVGLLEARPRWNAERLVRGVLLAGILLCVCCLTASASPTCQQVQDNTVIKVSALNGSNYFFESSIVAVFSEDSVGDPLEIGTNYDWQVAGCSQNTTSGYLDFSVHIKSSIPSCDPGTGPATVAITSSGGSHSNSGQDTSVTLHNDPAHGDSFAIGERVTVYAIDCNGNICGSSQFTITAGCK